MTRLAQMSKSLIAFGNQGQPERASKDGNFVNFCKDYGFYLQKVQALRYFTGP